MIAELFQLEDTTPLRIRDESLPLVSVIIISYNNVQFLYHAVKSVLSQKYGNYELTISDDASVGCTIEDSARLVCLAATDLIFEQNCNAHDEVDRRWKKYTPIGQEKLEYYHKKLEKWEKDNLGNYQIKAIEIIHKFFPNVKKIEFKRNKENQGTVKHLKALKKDSSGEYLMFLAADDKLHDCDVIKDMVGYFAALPEDACVLTSQCGMYDSNLENLYYYAVNDELKEIITKSTPKELFGELTDWCIIPAAGTIYKRKTFEVYGDLDEKYHLIEDWTYYLKITRNGGKIYYYDRLTYMHRDGGISHGNATGGNLAYKYYLEDCILLTRQEILPYLHQVPKKLRKRSLRRYRDTCREYTRKFQMQELNLFQKFLVILRYGDHYIPKLLFAILSFFEYRSRWMFMAGACMLLLSFLLSLSSGPNGESIFLYYLFGLVGTVSLFGSITVKTIYLILQLLKIGFNN